MEEENGTKRKSEPFLISRENLVIPFLSIQLFHGFHFPSIQPRLENISDNHVRCAIVSRGEKVSPREENSSIVSFHFFFFLLFFGQSRRSAASTRFAASGRSSVARVGARLTFGWSRTRNEKPTSAGCRGRRSPTDIPRDVPRRLEAGAPASCSRTRAIERGEFIIYVFLLLLFYIVSYFIIIHILQMLYSWQNDIF